MRNKSILFLDQYSNLSGGQKVLFNIVSYLCNENNNCKVILPEPGPLSIKLENIKANCIYFPMGYYSIGKKSFLESLTYLLRLPLLVILLCNYLRKEKVDLVYANGARTFPWATIACSLTNTPLVWHIHSIFSKGINKTICSYFGKFNCIKRIIAVSAITAAPFKELASKIDIIHNGVTIPSETGKSYLLKKEFGISDNELLIGCAGMLEEWKNQEDLIRAASICLSRHKNIRFFIIGDSLFKNGSAKQYKNKLVKLNNELNLKDKLIFTGFRSNINDIMNSLDILVICSKEPDPCPMVSLEAASLGLAIVSSNLGGVTEIFKDNEDILFYAPGDSFNLANKLNELIQNKELIQRLGANAKLKILKLYNLNVFLAKINSSLSKAYNV